MPRKKSICFLVFLLVFETDIPLVYDVRFHVKGVCVYSEGTQARTKDEGARLSAEDFAPNDLFLISKTKITINTKGPKRPQKPHDD